MKKITALLALVTALACSSTTFAGTTSVQPRSTETKLVKPVMSKIVEPTRLPRSFTRKVVKVRFAIDENGQPQNIQVLSRTDRDAKKQIVSAFKEWRFDVKALGMEVESKHFVLPLDIIPQA